MLYIVSLKVNQYDWTYSIISRLKKAHKAMDRFNRRAILISSPEHYSHSEHVDFCLKKLNAVVTDTDRVIFLNTSDALFYLMNATVDYDYEVLVHTSLDYLLYNKGVHSALFDINRSFKKIIVGNDYAGKTYNHPNYKVIGGFLDDYVRVDKKDFFVLVVGNYPNDDARGWARFVEIARVMPHIKFHLTTNSFQSRSPARNIIYLPFMDRKELEQLYKKTTHVVSTKNCETFGYSLFEAISFGATPLVVDNPCYKEYIPDKFRFNTLPNFEITANHSELENIVSRHHHYTTYQKLIG